MRGAGLAAAVIAAALTAGCSSPGMQANSQETVFYINTHVNFFGPAHTAELDDFTLNFWNQSRKSVRLRSISLVSPAGPVRFLGVKVYALRKIGYQPNLLVGDLPRECPRRFVAAPLSSLVVPAGRKSGRVAIVTIRITKPGVYRIRKVRIGYSTSSGRAWQYQNANVKLTVRNPPLPGPRPLPASQIC